MYSFLFRNKLAALAFVFLTLIGVRALVGSEDEQGILAKTASDIEQRQQSFADTVDEAGEAERRPVIMGPAPETEIVDLPPSIPFAGDAELIDKAEGIDPTPPDISGTNAIAEQGDVVIIVPNGSKR